MTAEHPMLNIIEPMIDQSLSILRSRAHSGDVAHGLLAALRRIRCAVEDIGGYAMVGILDSAIRDRLILRKLHAKRAGQITGPGLLPALGAGAALAETIMVNAADASLIYSSGTEDSTELLMTVFILIDRLIDTLQAAPESSDLLAWLRIGEEALAIAPEKIFDAPAASVH